jgi:hypothetical protein
MTSGRATGAKRELLKVPVLGEELPHSCFTRRRKERFDFLQDNSGKTVYICICFENSKGDEYGDTVKEVTREDQPRRGTGGGERVINNPALKGRGMLFSKGNCTQGFNTF